jgi:hypothetical protein
MTLKVKKKVVYLTISFFVLLFFSGFRYDVGVDWDAYYKYFGEDFFAMMERYHTKEMEPLNILLKKLLIVYEMDDGSYWIWTMAVITLFFTFIGIYCLSNNCILSVVLYVCMGFFFFTLNGVRQHCAVSISFFSLFFIQNRRFLPFLVLNLIAIGFHYTAFLIFPLYFIANRIYSKRFYLILILISVPLSFVISFVFAKIMLLFSFYQIYADSQYAMSNNNLLSYLRLFFPLFLFSIIYAKYNKLVLDKKYAVLFNLGMTSFVFTILFPGILLANRINVYFQLSLIILIPLIASVLPRYISRLFVVFCIVYNLLVCYVILFSRPDVKIVPYNLNFDILGGKLLLLTIFFLLVLFIFFLLLKRGFKRSADRLELSKKNLINE